MYAIVKTRRHEPTIHSFLQSATEENTEILVSFSAWTMKNLWGKALCIHNLITVWLWVTVLMHWTLHTGWHKKTGTFEKPNKNWRNPRKKSYWQKLNHCHYTFQKFPLFCVTLCVLHALQNATESHSAEHATHTGWHKRTGTFEMRSGSERMHTWRRTPSTGRNFQTLIIWITVS